MSVTAGFLGMIALLLLLAMRIPVAIAMVAVAGVGLWAMMGIDPAIGQLATSPYAFVNNWTLSSVPAFLLMGYVAFHAGLTGGLFDGAKILLRRIPGALAISSIFACSGFATVCGSSLATAAAMGKIAIPEMVKAGYRPSFATGCVAAGGTIGALIPPSILMIVYGVFAETSVTQVYLGGLSVGLLTAAAYSLVVLMTAYFRPDIVPSRPIEDGLVSAREALNNVWPVFALIAIVFGGMFVGSFTATEAGAVGALAAILISMATGRLSWTVLKTAVLETLMTSASLLMIGVGASMFTRFLALTGVTGSIATAVEGTGLGYFEIMTIIVIIYLILGCFMEPFGAMLVTLPIFMPILESHGVSLVWFGVLVVKLLEIGMITPPVGMNVFVIRNVASEYVTTMQVFRGVIPFFLVDLVVVALMVVAPGVVTVFF
jgi:tripartite ATP-independent transporter DctM subunit